jgi:hypothetical protein
LTRIETRLESIRVKVSTTAASIEPPGRTGTALRRLICGEFLFRFG